MSRLSPLNRSGPRKRLQRGWTDNPTGYAICYGCGMPTMHDDLREQMEYRGGLTPVPTGVLKCANCIDVPNAFFQLQVLRPDPEPLAHPYPDINGDQPAFIEREANTGLIELEDGSGTILLEDGDFPEFDL